jgi:hypothetical protein
VEHNRIEKETVRVEKTHIEAQIAKFREHEQHIHDEALLKKQTYAKILTQQIEGTEEKKREEKRLQDAEDEATKVYIF